MKKSRKLRPIWVQEIVEANPLVSAMSKSNQLSWIVLGSDNMSINAELLFRLLRRSLQGMGRRSRVVLVLFKNLPALETDLEQLEEACFESDLICAESITSHNRLVIMIADNSSKQEVLIS